MENPKAHFHLDGREQFLKVEFIKDKHRKQQSIDKYPNNVSYQHGILSFK